MIVFHISGIVSIGSYYLIFIVLEIILSEVIVISSFTYIFKRKIYKLLFVLITVIIMFIIGINFFVDLFQNHINLEQVATFILTFILIIPVVLFILKIINLGEKKLFKRKITNF